MNNTVDNTAVTAVTAVTAKDQNFNHYDLTIIRHAWILRNDYTDRLDRCFFLKGKASEILDRIDDYNPSREDKLIVGSWAYTITYSNCSYQWLVDNEEEELFMSVRVVRDRNLFIICLRPVRGWSLNASPGEFLDFVNGYK